MSRRYIIYLQRAAYTLQINIIDHWIPVKEYISKCQSLVQAKENTKTLTFAPCHRRFEDELFGFVHPLWRAIDRWNSSRRPFETAHPSRKQLAPVIHQRRVENAEKFTGKRCLSSTEFHERRKRLSPVSKSKATRGPEFLSPHQASHSKNYNAVHSRPSATDFNCQYCEHFAEFTSFRHNSIARATGRASARKQSRWN